MDTDAFTPDLSKLEQDYQILTELHRSPDSRTYLARHLELNRDVTITVVRSDSRAAVDGGVPSLSRFAGDVERLKTARHPNVIPVIEGRWLGDGTYAVVRARARGATLDQLVSATGAMQTARVASTLEQVQSALDWARSNAIANRSVDPASMIFQQGSGRVLLSFEPSTSAAMADGCEDARLIGRLGWEMLAGQPLGAAQTKSLAALRPDLPPNIVAETDALMHCAPGSAPNVNAYLAMLSGTTPATTPEVSPVAAAVAVPAVATPVGALSDAVVVQQRGWGFGKRFGVGVAVLATIAILAFVFMHPGSLPVISRTAAGGGQQTAGEAAGDVASNAGQPDTAVVNSSSAVPYPASQFSAPPPNAGVSVYPQSPAPAPMPMPSTPAPMPATVPSPMPAYPSPTAAPTMSATMPQTAGPPPTPLAPPTTRRHEPLTTPPPLRMPSADSMRASQDSLRAKQDSAWAALDRKLHVHSDTSSAHDTAHAVPVVPPPIPPIETTRPAHTDPAPPDTTITARPTITNL
jgi:serine/threonine-protein kinase